MIIVKTDIFDGFSTNYDKVPLTMSSYAERHTNEVFSKDKH